MRSGFLDGRGDNVLGMAGKVDGTKQGFYI